MRRGSRAKRRKARPELRGRSFRVQVYENAADLGDQLTLIRERRVYLEEGYATFEDWCRRGFPASESVKAMGLTPAQADQLIAEALALAARRRKSTRGSGTR
jgi:hypothetical protein